MVYLYDVVFRYCIYTTVSHLLALIGADLDFFVACYCDFVLSLCFIKETASFCVIVSSQVETAQLIFKPEACDC